ncbi:MAG: 50S ribosomal protein L11 methyltransferase, partial [Duodenibacillus sp.]|nr:50S ribosomal protein L11 methyltransferase [Duodenibacillus sp.]
MLREIVILCDERSADALCDELMDLGVMSVTVEDADADSPDERPLFGEPGMPVAAEAWPRSRLRLLVSEDFASGTVAEAARALGLAAPAIEAEAPVPDADWVRITQAQFQPSRISGRLWIVPTWHEPPDPSAINIRLDPGVAFGTGSHATTRLCLAWLDGNVTAADTVIDYGCGTGILAIAAARLGAARVAGTDIEVLNFCANNYLGLSDNKRL